MTHLAEAATALTPESTIPLGMLWTILSAVVVGAFAAAGMWFQLRSINGSLRTLAKHGWTVADHEHWTTQLRDRNPTLHVPKAKKIVPVDQAAGE